LCFMVDNLKLITFRTWPSFLLLGLFLIPACAPSRVSTRQGVPFSAESIEALKRFEKAEHLFQEQAYLEALDIYKDYLREFPGGSLADTALMKIGLVYMAVEDYPQARQAFESLVSHYPNSPFVEDARLNVIVTYDKEGDYRSAERYAGSALRSAQTPHQAFRIHNLMGYTYSASNQFKDGIESFMKAYQLASGQERAETLSKVKELITYLKEPELKSLLETYGDSIPGGYLRLQLAREYASEDLVDMAMNVLSDMIRLFPQHEEVETARALMEELESRMRVNPFLIGCILPLTGPYGTFGNRALTGIELALQRFNGQPDVNPMQLLIQDSKGDPNETAMALETLALTHGVVGIIGPMITSESAAIKAQALRVPIMTLTQKPNITLTGDYVFRDFLTLSLQVKAIVNYAVGDLNLQKFAVLYPEERYGVSFMNRFWDELISRGAEVVGIESYGTEQTDFSDAIKKLVGLYYPRPERPPGEEIRDEGVRERFLEPEEKTGRVATQDTPEAADDRFSDQGELPQEDQGALEEEDQEQWSKQKEEPEPIIDFEAIFIPDGFEKVGLIAPQLLFHDVADVLLLGTNLWHSEKLIEMARGYVQGAIVPDGFFVNSPSPRVRDFVNSYQEVFGSLPAFLEAQAYDAAWILFEAANKPGVRSRRTLKEAIMEVKDFPGVTGVTSFDETGDVDKDLYLLRIEGGRFVQIKP
jgi:branched-chain amino acid transport system substrate-binding protein